MSSRLLNAAGERRRDLRFRLWAARARFSLARLSCDLELVAPHGAAFATPPALDATRQVVPAAAGGGRGRLRIELGRNVHLGRQVTIEIVPGADNRLVLGDGTTFGTAVRIALFGGSIDVGPYSRLRDGVMFKSSGQLVAGPHLIAQNGSILHCAQAVSLDSHVVLGERVSILDSDHVADGSDVYTQDQPIATQPVHLARNVWVGANAVILRGAQLGANSVVAAGSVVRGGEHPPGWLIAGVPAEAKRALADGSAS